MPTPPPHKDKFLLGAKCCGRHLCFQSEYGSVLAWKEATIQLWAGSGDWCKWDQQKSNKLGPIREYKTEMRLETSKPSGQERGRWVVGIWWRGERHVGGGECGERGERRSGEGWGWWQGPSTTSAVGQPGCCTALPLQGASWVELSHPGSMGLDPRPQALSWGQGGVGGGVTAGGPPSVQFSSVVSDSLRPHRLQHTRPPCPLPTPRVYSNSCPLSLWCHTTTSSSAIPFSPCLQSFPASRSFQMSQFFASGGQSIGVSAFQWIFRTDFL